MYSIGSWSKYIQFLQLSAEMCGLQIGGFEEDAGIKVIQAVGQAVSTEQYQKFRYNTVQYAAIFEPRKSVLTTF